MSMFEPYDERFYERFYVGGKPREPERGQGEDLEAKVNILLRVFAPQVEEIREKIYQERYARYEKRLAEWEAYREAQKEKEVQREVELAELAKTREAFLAEYEALDDCGIDNGLAISAGHRLAGKFKTVDDVRNASDEKILYVDGIGWKTLDAIRKRIHDHKWETFTTETGRSGSYCDGCKARTGFVAC